MRFYIDNKTYEMGDLSFAGEFNQCYTTPKGHVSKYGLKISKLKKFLKFGAWLIRQAKPLESLCKITEPEAMMLQIMKHDVVFLREQSEKALDSYYDELLEKGIIKKQREHSGDHYTKAFEAFCDYLTVMVEHDIYPRGFMLQVFMRIWQIGFDIGEENIKALIDQKNDQARMSLAIWANRISETGKMVSSVKHDEHGYELTVTDNPEEAQTVVISEGEILREKVTEMVADGD